MGVDEDVVGVYVGMEKVVVEYLGEEDFYVVFG